MNVVGSDLQIAQTQDGQSPESPTRGSKVKRSPLVRMLTFNEPDMEKERKGSK